MGLTLALRVSWELYFQWLLKQVSVNNSQREDSSLLQRQGWFCYMLGWWTYGVVRIFLWHSWLYFSLIETFKANFFSQTVHICVHCVDAMYVHRCSSPMVLALLGPCRLSGTNSHGEPPLAILSMTTLEPSNRGSKWRLDWFSCRTSHWIWAVAHHTPSNCMFSWRPKCQIPVWDHRGGLWISINPRELHPLPTPQPKRGHQNLTKFLTCSQNCPLKLFYGIFCCDEKP